MRSTVRRMPCCSQRRAEVTTGARTRCRALPAFETRGQLDVLHERNRRVTAETFENVTAHEDRLIAGGDAGERRAPVHAALDDAIGGPRAVETDIETAPEMTGLDRRAHVAQRLRRQARVHVQEQQNVGAGFGGAGVHLRRAATRGIQQTDSRMVPHDVTCRIIAAAIDDDDLVRPLFQNPGERGVEDAGLV